MQWQKEQVMGINIYGVFANVWPCLSWAILFVAYKLSLSWGVASHLQRGRRGSLERWIICPRWCCTISFWTVVLEKTLESPLDCKEIQPVHPKGYQSWVFIGRTNAEAETPILWPPVSNNLLIWKDPDAGEEWRQEEKGTIEGEMVGWHHRLNGHEFEEALGVGDEQGGLVCCSPWGRKESDRIEQLNWTE